MFNAYFHLVELVDTVRQYGDKKVRKVLENTIPYAGKALPDYPVVLAKWFYDYMTWDDSPALPRRDDVLHVLKQRRGRCGEYANLFTAMLVAAGRKARMVFDFTDHVWTEYFDEEKGWVALDSTLGNPVIERYFRDNKPLSYILAIEPSKITDVTKNYTTKWEDVKKRRNPMIDALIESFNLGAERQDWE